MPGDVEEAAAAPAAPRKKFPTPQYVVIIYCRTVVTVDGSADRPERVDAAWNAHLLDQPTNASGASGTFRGNSTQRRRKIRVKMQSLLVKMVNRLVREEIIPAEAVSVVAGASYISIRILVASSAVPVIVLRCERIGVGNVTGTVHACPLETSLVPPATKKEIDMCLYSGDDGLSSKVSAAGKSDVSTAEGKPASLSSDKKHIAEGDVEDDDADEYISDSDDHEDDEGKDHLTVPSSVDVPFLSPERKKRLQECIVEARREWRNSSSRVRVMQVIEEVTASASFTFDYALFVVCAGLIAAAGLGTDSGPTVIASMLVSPIMGPVMAMTFGTTVRSKKLIVKGFRNELMSIFICFLMGAITCVIAVAGETPQKRGWPSEEMLARGDVLGLTSGIYIAIPSGVAVALSTLGKNSSGMVGAAISLSLLPPAVNASMCWTYELLLLSSAFDRNEGDTTNYWSLGGISLALSCINIVCIWLAGTFTFWLKEVAPIEEKNAFWKADVQYYREHKGEKADIHVIDEGIQAALELQNAVATNDDLYKTAKEFDITDHQVADARRRGLATNAVEDAFYVDGNALKAESIVPGGAVDLNGAELEDAAETALKEDLLSNANKFGCLEEAGKKLFDNDLLPDDAPVQSDVGIRHGAVAEAVLLHGLS